MIIDAARNILTKEAPNPVVLLFLIDSQMLPKVSLEPRQQQNWQFFVRKFTSFQDGADALSRISIDTMYSIASLCQALVTVKSGTSLGPDASITIGEGITIELSRATGCSEGSSQMTGESRISKAAWRSKGLLSCHELCPEPLLLFLYLFSTSSPLSLRSYECEQRLVEEPNWSFLDASR